MLHQGTHLTTHYPNRTQFWPPVDPRIAAAQGKELWDIGPEMLYVSNLGRVARSRIGRLLEQSNLNGYRAVSLTVGPIGSRRRLRLYVHRLVAVTFDGPHPGQRVRCLNGPEDCRLSSLSWETSRGRLPPEVRAEIVRRLEGGERQADVARAVGAERAVVHYWSRKRLLSSGSTSDS